MVEGMAEVEVVEEEAAYGDVLHGGCGEQPEGELEGGMVGGMVEEEQVPTHDYENVAHYGSYKVVGMGEGVVGMDGDKGEDRVVGTVGVVVGDSM